MHTATKYFKVFIYLCGYKSAAGRINYIACLIQCCDGKGASNQYSSYIMCNDNNNSKYNNVHSHCHDLWITQKMFPFQQCKMYVCTYMCISGDSGFKILNPPSPPPLFYYVNYVMWVMLDVYRTQNGNTSKGENLVEKCDWVDDYCVVVVNRQVSHSHSYSMA